MAEYLSKIQPRRMTGKQTEGQPDDVTYKLPREEAIPHLSLGENKPKRTVWLPLGVRLTCYSEETLFSPFIMVHSKQNVNKDEKRHWKWPCSVHFLMANFRLKSYKLHLSLIFKSFLLKVLKTIVKISNVF